MNPQRSLVFVLVALQAAALAYCFRTPLFSAVMVGLALVGWLSKIRVASPELVKRWGFVLVALYFVERSVVPAALYSGSPSFLVPDSCLIAEYFLVFQVIQFFVRYENDRLPSYLPILAIAVLTFTGDFRANDRARLVFQLVTIGLIVLVAVYFAMGRTRSSRPGEKRFAGYGIWLVAVLVVSGALGWLAASSLFYFSRDIETLLVNAMNPQVPAESAGFSGQGRLGSIARQKQNSESRVALRVYADDSPGYLRGRAFETYRQSQWRNSSRQVPLAPTNHNDAASGGPRTFSLIPLEGNACRRLEIWPNEPFKEVVFTPPGLVALEIPVDKLSVNMHGIFETEDLLPGIPYTAVVSEEALDASSLRSLLAGAPHEAAPRDAAAAWEALTAVPDKLDPRIHELATRVVGEAATPAEKIAAVEGYFLKNYQYQFGIDIPSGKDPLTYFLLEKPPAHCEYFASGAALLLRLSGVPCRYVTGFVVAERNNYGDYWVARNRDAHAWVEAFDPDQGWTIVEATPAGGLPQSTSASAASQLWDAIRAWWQRLVSSIRGGGVGAVLRRIVGWLLQPWCLTVFVLIAAAIAGRWMWRRRGRRPALPRDPHVLQLHQLLRAMDQRWRKAGLQRHPHETLHQFAQRISEATPDAAARQAAQWYRQYAATRFGGTVDAASVKSLSDLLAASDSPSPAS